MRIGYSPAARDVISQTNTAVFLLAVKGDLQGKEIADILLKAIPKIVRFSRKYRAPYLAKISREGSVKEISD
ncbi:MAG: hypothetical protein A2268_02220 [Candidatus Raymondbacteria bacterium RifOxyA12_full_50_37]|uniref:Uncharacterized protein n=1 Tax=Candidatus Raymondbacteria bacterium RIFOXYD12_FULL_49_13 TaxID=1817890 RepID=A0A1F7F5L1_UNCRA|nr:MAG: hypothetical protein A2268_02220 [Candidatus Raymondbacteria bacterium RifOxyA12_full_50_37]OGJ92241.1 MAG: hypothetical protein A2248_11050 [Candidatus Raymondbacteria bacterium RIFOXYA2_FULL_49_16]OGJ97859.1 MAG: hypothetical protein A2487_21560 [Candidatus Raymondbacteria bacterium RifOxyC12_full_50_8]OGJ98567.1 MAG: hypothetical protein A2453_06850 [Candidatus Raymondbacteria bacterium RIFOXYC2_FULL_50_21]OGK01868.1 MAG: hypothetical protein A2519_04745 [Candidatus Raymondbacteria b